MKILFCNIAWMESICKFNMGDFLKEHKVSEKIKVLKY